MNTKTTKFLAVLAVLAMAFAAVAIAIPATDVNGTPAETDFVDSGLSFDIKTGASTTQSVKVYALSTATVEKKSYGAAFSGYMVNSSPNFGVGTNYHYMGYAEVGLFFGNMSSITTGSMKIEQKTTFTSLFADHLNNRQSVDANETTVTSIFDLNEFTTGMFAETAAFGVLVPQDGSSVELKITTYNGAVDKTGGNHKWKCGGTELGSVTYVLDFSKTYTKIKLGTTAISTGLWDQQKWDYTVSSYTGTLNLNGVGSSSQPLQASFVADGLTSGFNVITKAGTSNYLAAYTADANGVIHSANAITIKNENTTTAGSLYIYQMNPKGYGISAAGVTIGATDSSNSETLFTEVVSQGGARAINSSSTIAIVDSNVRAEASENAICATSNFTTTGDNYILAHIDGTFIETAGYTNDIFGTKITGTVAISNKTLLLTDGLHVVSATLSNSGLLYIYGDYVQNPNANLALPIAGMYLDAYASALSVKKIAAASSSDDAGIYFIGDVDYYAPASKVTVNDTISGKTEIQETISSSDAAADAIQTKINTAGAEKDVVINITAALTNAQTITTSAGQNLELRTVGNGKVSATINLGAANNNVGLTDFQGAASFTNGSIVMNIVDWYGGDVTIGNGDVLKLVGTSANIAGNVMIAGPTAEGTSASVIIDDAQSLNITGTLNVTGNVKVNNDGALIGNGTVSIGENATFYTTKPVSVNFTGAGTIIIDDATQTVRLNGKYNSQNSYTPTQKVIIDGDLTIEDNAYIIINGGLEVLDGVTVNILNGGYLKVQSVTAYADIKGNIKSNSENGFVIDGSVTGDISISGNITASKASVDDKATVKILGNATLTGNLTVNTKAAAQFGQLSVESTGTLTVNGAISGTFYNAGLVTINGSVGTTTISASAADAVVDIVAIKSGTLTITDEDMYLRTVDGVREKVAEASANVMTFTNVSGVNVTENIVFYTMDDVQYVYNATYLSGTATVADKKTEIAGNYPLITIDNGYNNYIISTFTVTQAKVQINSPAYLTVTGLAYVENTDLTMTNLPNAETGLAVAADAKLTVTGILRSTTDEIALSTSINAVKFSKMEDAVLYIYYTNLSDAIASGVKDLEVLGKLTISKDTVIPAGYEIDASGKAVDIGSQKYPEVTLTIEDGGSLSAGTVTVYGTMYVEDVDTGLTASSIISDTSNVTDKDATYTNIYFALNTAKAGETVKITNKDGRVIISKNVTIPAGVTLSVPANEILGIQEGYTLTVAGYLLNRGTVSAYEYVPATKTYVGGEFAEEANSTHAAIAVTGTIESMTSMPYATYKIPGAYYTYKTMSFITSLPNSAAIINDAEGKVIDVYGSKMAYGTVTYAGTPTAPVTVRIHDTVASGTINLSYGTINLDVNDGYVLKIVGANGSINLADVEVTTASVITAAAIDGAEILKMTAGAFKADTNASVDGMKKKMTFDGNVEVSGSTLYKATVTGTLLLSGNVTLNGATNVSGTLAVNNEAVVNTVVVGNTAADVTVTGTLAVYDATATKAAGDMNIAGILYIGGSSNLYTTSKYAAAVASVASVSGDVSVTGQYIVFPGSTVAGKVSDIIDGIIEDKKYTAFYAEESLFVTVYAVADTAITSKAGGEVTSYFVPKSLEDCDFVLWQYLSSGELNDIKDAKNVGAYQAVYAKINYNLYSVTIVTDEGVKSVAIDGVEMISTGFNYFKTDNNGVGSKLVAGTHTVTYTLKNGYEGTAVLSTAMGTILKDNKFVVSGTEDADRAVTYQLTGTEQIVTPEPSPVEQNEWTITTILLVILVILIAIMAVIVALRLNRS